MKFPAHLLRPAPVRAALAAFVLALGFAWFTQHVWEDYYITYRSSRNLATGQGLVFNPGDRLHTFTSPLGVLLPAVSLLLTGNSSDTAALWIFRVFCAAALGGAAALLVRTTARAGWGAAAAALVGGWIATDAKVLDFTINGMETAFMLLFLAYALWAHQTEPRRAWLHLGAAWAGLMWTRPDSFIYVGLVAVGWWLFRPDGPGRPTRRELLATGLRAGLVTTALYLPWLLWAAWYYGTPVPHTIAAKGALGGPHSLAGLLQTAAMLPWLAWSKSASLELTYLPSYYMIGGWPPAVVLAGRAVATVAALLWLVPRLGPLARTASFACFGAHVYLTYFPYFPFPWYIPPTALLATVALGGAVQALAGAARGRLAVGLAAAFVLAGGWLTVEVARQVRVQQEIVEDGNRRQIGLWLKEHARPGDTVFMEPLGYIGYFSGLKTYDYPGMSSREIVRARHLLGENWVHLIPYLQPDWLVLRPREVRDLTAQARHLLTEVYVPAQVFDVTEAVRRHDLRGRAYLEHDAVFTVYRRTRATRHDVAIGEATSPFGVSATVEDGRDVWFAHAPGDLLVPVPEGAREVTVTFGFAASAHRGDRPTDGAEFLVIYADRRGRTTLGARTLRPFHEPGERGLHQLTFPLPAARAGDGRLLLRTNSLATLDQDWTCWGAPEFR